VSSASEAEEIARLASDRSALLVYTSMTPEVLEALEGACQKHSTDALNLWGTLLQALERKFGVKRSGVYGRRQPVSPEYLQIVKAIEYTRKVDDGVLPNLWDECDIMLIGPSRAGKTPLAFYLAQRGFKVANYPLVVDEDPPKELFTIDQKKCFALTIQPEKLQAIRIERMKQFKSIRSQSYDNISDIKKEISWMKTFYIQKGNNWPIIDTTDSGVVETAARIMQILDRRKGNSLDAAYVSVMQD
jgi:regulator of PEP synthase PpsR (kinase-PPPase family)